jgi:Coenzyme PQQ synthesis protein D (PqqD)
MTDLLEPHPERVEGLEITAVMDGYVVHDASRDRIHYLNQTGALILELCTGRVAESDVARLVQRTYDLPEPPLADVQACLANFRREGLVR